MNVSTVHFVPLLKIFYLGINFLSSRNGWIASRNKSLRRNKELCTFSKYLLCQFKLLRFPTKTDDDLTDPYMNVHVTKGVTNGGHVGAL